MTTPYRGICGRRIRERDEGQDEPSTTALRPGRCADTGADIQPGDLIQLREDGQTVLVRAVAPRPRPPTP